MGPGGDETARDLCVCMCVCVLMKLTTQHVGVTTPTQRIRLDGCHLSQPERYEHAHNAWFAVLNSMQPVAAGLNVTIPTCSMSG